MDQMEVGIQTVYPLNATPHWSIWHLLQHCPPCRGWLFTFPERILSERGKKKNVVMVSRSFWLWTSSCLKWIQSQVMVGPKEAGMEPAWV